MRPSKNPSEVRRRGCRCLQVHLRRSTVPAAARRAGEPGRSLGAPGQGPGWTRNAQVSARVGKEPTPPPLPAPAHPLPFPLLPDAAESRVGQRGSLAHTDSFPVSHFRAARDQAPERIRSEGKGRSRFLSPRGASALAGSPTPRNAPCCLFRHTLAPFFPKAPRSHPPQHCRTHPRYVPRPRGTYSPRRSPPTCSH